ncbi:hypothetical protein GCM10009850_113020 [Nonomuraea monospora]|uniref:HTH cro/C1-type domain-containing protein n=1 Tax=Nonomuraea monospora TaxID=568818 RepID=A0ABP5PW13_9ACTN
MSEESAFGVLLRDFRRAAELTIEQLSHASGVSVRAIGDMERGVSRGPQRRTVAALAEVLRLSPEEHDSLLAAARAGRPRPAAAGGACALPRGIGDFTGRAHELGLMRELAIRHSGGEGPAVTATIWGPAGMGKTALAVHAADRLTELFPDGQFFLDLRGLDPAPLASGNGLARLLKALGVAERRIPADEQERAGHYRDLLRERRCLIVLDNAASETQVRPLLPGGGPSMTLITSRRPLAGLEGVHPFPLSQLTEAEAAGLLQAIMGEARTTAEPDAVEELARLCGHLPLAMRIAGNRLLSRPGWTIKQLTGRLDDEERRLDALAAGDLHVAAAFALSYEQLSPTARQTFRWLALAAGPDFGAPLAAVLARLDLYDAEDALEELVELGLLSSPYAGRYRFHDLVRLFARARLSEEEPPAGRQEGLRRMNHWLLEVATVAGRWFEPGYGAPEAGWSSLVRLDSKEEAVGWLEAESAAWLAALKWAAAEGEHARVVEVAESMHWFSDRWTHWGHWQEVFELSRRAAQALKEPGLEATHANYLSWALSTCEGRHEEGIRAALEALEVATKAGDVRQQGWALNYAAWAAKTLPDFERGAGYASRAATLFQQAGDMDGYPQAMGIWGECLHRLGRLDEALSQHLKLIATLRDPAYGGSPDVTEFSLGLTLGRVAMVLGELRRWREAVDHLREALTLLRKHRLLVGIRNTALELGRALVQLDAQLGGGAHRAEARAAFQEAVTLSETVGDDEGLLVARQELAALDA